MLTIDCSGSPHNVGKTHGTIAKHYIERGISFYTGLFLEYSKKSWPEVRELAQNFEPKTKSSWPQYYEEMAGIAEGSGLHLLDIVALNVRTEIAFGLFSDGCTSLSWHGQGAALLGQNWDWMPAQKQNMIVLRIAAEGERPSIAMITEAGIVGKIGFNSFGVGVCLNAIKTPGCDRHKLPVHLGLRMALESRSAVEAADKMEAIGMASSAHMLIADGKGAIGFEFTAKTFHRLFGDDNNCVVHSNHLIGKHSGISEPTSLEKMRELSSRLIQSKDLVTVQNFGKLFDDECNYPAAICRTFEGASEAETLFNIVMDVKKRLAFVKIGKPVSPDEEFELRCI